MNETFRKKVSLALAMMSVGCVGILLKILQKGIKINKREISTPINDYNIFRFPLHLNI